MKRINDNPGPAAKPKPEPAWVGRRVLIHGQEHFLAQAEWHKVAAIDLRNGNRWRDPLEIRNPLRISPVELEAVCGDTDPKSSQYQLLPEKEEGK